MTKADLLRLTEALLAENRRLEGILKAVKDYPYISQGMADMIRGLEKAPAPPLRLNASDPRVATLIPVACKK